MLALTPRRYADAPSSGLPGDPASSDPGPGVDNLGDVDGMSVLVPLVRDPAPEVTRAYPMSFSFQRTDDGRYLGFMNTTVRVMLCLGAPVFLPTCRGY
jgi:iron transport multicopper oxidase